VTLVTATWAASTYLHLIAATTLRFEDQPVTRTARFSSLVLSAFLFAAAAFVTALQAAQIIA
jgi:hypothetical protein